VACDALGAGPIPGAPGKPCILVSAADNNYHTVGVSSGVTWICKFVRSAAEWYGAECPAKALASSVLRKPAFKRGAVRNSPFGF
jgi:hypothetical protein